MLSSCVSKYTKSMPVLKTQHEMAQCHRIRILWFHFHHLKKKTRYQLLEYGYFTLYVNYQKTLRNIYFKKREGTPFNYHFINEFAPGTRIVCFFLKKKTANVIKSFANNKANLIRFLSYTFLNEHIWQKNSQNSKELMS